MRVHTFAGVLRLLAVFAFALGAAAFLGAPAFFGAAALVAFLGAPTLFFAAVVLAVAGFSFCDNSKQSELGTII